jgi:hypothetical protein
MGFYIVFNNFSSLLDTSQSTDFAEDIDTAVADLVNKAGVDVSEGGQVTILVEPDGEILLKVDDSSDGAVSAIDYDQGAAALLSQVLAVSAPEVEQTQLPKIEPEVSSRNEDNDKFYPMFEKHGISLRYRIDHVDILKSRQEIENSESAGKLAEKNLKKERAGQDQQAERRFQEKQIENFRECLKQRRFASHLQNKSE